MDSAARRFRQLACRLGRRTAVVAWLSLGLFAIVAWAVSYFVVYTAGYAYRDGSEIGIDSVSGHVRVLRLVYMGDQPVTAPSVTGVIAYARTSNAFSVLRPPRGLGFQFERIDLGQVGEMQTAKAYVLWLPYWAVVVPWMALTLCWLIRKRRQLQLFQRLQLGLCLTCGYDLRATPDRCPECGTVPDKPPEPSGSVGKVGGTPPTDSMA